MIDKKQYGRSVATILSIFALGQIPGSIDAAIAKIAEAFRLSSSSALYVTTVASLTSVACGLGIGFIAGKKLSYRRTLFLCALVEVVSALIPFLCTHFGVILVVRAFFGLGIGGMMSLENTMATLLITPDKRPKILGLAMFCGFGSNCLLQWVGGLLADIAWNYVFLTHLFLLIPLVILLACCPDVAGNIPGGKTAQAKASDKLPPPVLGIALVMMLIGVMIAPLLIGCSFLSAMIIDSATVAGVVAVCFSLGCMSGGLLYPKLYQCFQRYCTAVFLTIIAAGSTGCALTRNIVVLCVWIFIAGMGFVLTQSSLMMLIGLITPSSKIAVASAVFMALFNLGMFGSALFEHLIGVITGDSLYVPLYIAAVVYLVFAALFFLRSPFPESR